MIREPTWTHSRLYSLPCLDNRTECNLILSGGLADLSGYYSSLITLHRQYRIRCIWGVGGGAVAAAIAAVAVCRNTDCRALRYGSDLTASAPIETILELLASEAGPCATATPEPRDMTFGDLYGLGAGHRRRGPERTAGSLEPAVRLIIVAEESARRIRYNLPEDLRGIFYRASEFEACFSSRTVRQLMDASLQCLQRRCSLPTGSLPCGPGDLLPLPCPEALPLVVAVRLGIGGLAGFPPVPVYSVGGAGRGSRAGRVPLQAGELSGLTRCELYAAGAAADLARQCVSLRESYRPTFSINVSSE